MLAAGSSDQTISLWDVELGVCRRWLEGHFDVVTAVAWSPDGQSIASASDDGTVMLWEPETGKLRRTLRRHQGWVTCVAWSPDGQTLASGSADQTIGLWDSESGELHRVLQGHSGRITNLAWSPDGQILASTSFDCTVRLWDTESWTQVGILEGHHETVRCAAFSPDGLLLASKSWDDTVRLWRSDTREPVANLDEPASGNWAAGLAFHPHDPVLATLGETDCVLRIWDVDEGALLTCEQAAKAVHYSNAKVVLVGDSGVGKSGLGLVLAASPFRPTESTHGRHVWTFESRDVPLGDGRMETRETLLWDLAGQPGYRLVHQLHLNEVAVALIVFDAKSETDPFAGVKYWDRALRQAYRLRGDPTPPPKKFLVAARTDRGGVGVSTRRIHDLTRELCLDSYFETSAKEGWNIRELAEAIRGAIDWEALPKISSTDLFQRIKGFLVAEKESGRVLASVDDLFRAFLKANGELVNAEELRPQFEACIGLVEARGLIKRLSFGDLVLLQPELLDAYASAMVNAAKNEPDGLGSLPEENARAGRFPMSEDERLADRAQERLLLIATVEDLLRHEIALLEYTDEGPRLVFPSQVTREHSGLSDPEGKAVVFGFEGPVLNIYATLAVRLTHSGIFKKKEMWQNAAAYEATDGGSCGLILREVQEGAGELTLFFDPVASEVVRFQFEEYIHAQLRRRALPNTVRRQRVFACSACSTPVTNLQASRRRERGFDWIVCSVCGERISLLDYEDRLRAVSVSKMAEMDRTADAKRNRDTSASILQGKIATNDFDVFLCHNTRDKPAVKEIGRRLKERGILPWLDVEQLQPGLPWQSALEKQIKKIRSVAVFVGKQGIGPWQDMELAAFLREFVSRKCPVIPVILLGSPKVPRLPVFLSGMIWVDFRNSEPEPMDQLVWGITGNR